MIRPRPSGFQSSVDGHSESFYTTSTSMSQPDYSWAEYLDYMEGGGSDVVSLPAAKPLVAPETKKKEQPLWGVLVAIGLTLAAIWLSERPFAPFTLAGGLHPIQPVMLAILLGM